jgi:hypothetical protein
MVGKGVSPMVKLWPVGLWRSTPGFTPRSPLNAKPAQPRIAMDNREARSLVSSPLMNWTLEKR